MAILAFQKPDKVILLEADEQYGKFEFRPLEPGYGITVGNALRRILLSSLEGFAITSIKIEGVDHDFFSFDILNHSPEAHLFHVQDNFSDIFHYSCNGRELMVNTFYLNRGNGESFE